MSRQAERLELEKAALEARVARMKEAMKLLAPGLADVRDIEEFPARRPSHNSAKIPHGSEIRAYRSVEKSFLALYGGQLAALVIFESPLLDDLKYDDILDFAEELLPLMPDLARSNIACDVCSVPRHPIRRR